MKHQDRPPAIQAIETRFLGYRFRSRLEARWAVFFNSLRIEFQYEPEGFNLPDGLRYLPDFCLPQCRLYAEVKPLPLNPEELSKCRQLAIYSDMDTLLLVGPPDFKVYDACISVDLDGSPEVQISDFLLDIDYHNRIYYDHEHRLYGACGGDFDKEEDFTDEYRAAVYASRAYRFEEVA